MLDDSNLVFIISQPRSGSTLLQSIISNNEFVNTASEPWLLFHFLSYFNPHLIKAEYSEELAYDATKHFLEKAEFQEGIKEEVKNFISRVYQKTLGKDKNTKYILDKTPRYYEIIDSISEIFSSAKIIVIKRNPLAVLNSMIDTRNVKSINQLYSKHRDILEAPFLLHNFVSKNRSNSNVLTTTYELLTGEAQQEAEKIYQWLNIDFEEKHLNYGDNTKFRGRYGDPIGIQQATEPVKKNKNWVKKLEDSYWKDFFIGYANYLGDDFIKSYGYGEDKVEGKKTDIFETFKFISDKKIPDHPPIDKHIQYLRYRCAYKLYAR